MKKIIFFICVIFLVSSCTVIDSRYTEKRVRVEPVPYYDHYYPSYMHYGYGPYFWTGFSWMNYFWLYDYYYYYPYYYGGYPYYYRGYGYYYPTYVRYGKTVIKKRELQKRPSGSTQRGTIRRISTSTTKTRGTNIRTSSSSRGSSSKVRKKD